MFSLIFRTTLSAMMSDKALALMVVLLVFMTNIQYANSCCSTAIGCMGCGKCNIFCCNCDNGCCFRHKRSIGDITSTLNPKDNAIERFQMLDLNHNGFIDLDEYLSFTQNTTANIASFNNLDTNQNGKIDKREMSLFLE